MKLGRIMKAGLLSAVTVGTLLLPAIDSWAEQRRMNINAVACRSKDATMQVNRWLSEGDRGAVAKEIMAGSCQMLDKGTPVYIESHGIEWAKVRARGSNTVVWTLEKFVR